MRAIAERNAQEYGLSDRTDYVQSNGSKMPVELVILIKGTKLSGCKIVGNLIRLTMAVAK